MRKFDFFMLSLLTAMGTGTAYADITYPYEVDFNTQIDVSSTSFLVADDWAHKVSSLDKNSRGDQVYAEYVWNATGGVDNTGYLQAKSQYVECYDWDYGKIHDYLEDMLVTPAIKGKSTIQVKKEGDDACTFQVYVLTQNKWGSWLKSGQPLVALSKNDLSSDWTEVELPEVEEGTRLGLWCSNVGIDNFKVSGEAAPAASKLAVYSASGRTAWPGDGIWNFGPVAAQSLNAKITLKNDGDADLNVTSIDATNGFTAKLDAEGAIAPGASQTVSIGLAADAEGEQDGTLTVTTDGGTFTLQLAAYAYNDADVWTEGFEGGTSLPAGMTREPGWTFMSKGDIIATDADKYLAHANTTNEAKLVTPLLAFGEGDALLLQMARTTAYESDPVNIYYSTDRANWTLAKTIEATELPKTKADYSYTSKTFKIDAIPAGEYYVAIGAKSLYLDNIVGGKKVDVAHDWALSSVEAPTAAMVNNAATFNAKLHNVNTKAEATDAYTATLLVDGQAVATAQSQDIAAGEEAAFTLAYTPHAEGTINAQVVFAAAGGEYQVASQQYTIEVAAESAATEIVTGEAKKLDNGLPTHMYNNKSVGVMLYTPAKLAGLKKGDKIEKLVFKGFGANFLDKNYSSHLKVWIENTEDLTQKSPEVSPLDTANMAKIYDDTYVWPIAGENELGKTADILTLTFAEPFVYDGGSLRLVVDNAGDYFRNIKFETEADKEGLAYIRTADDDLFDAEGYDASVLPVAHIFTISDPKTVSGKVTDNEDTPVAGASILLKSGDVEYYATTAEDGTYTVTVIQSSLAYQATATSGEFSAAAPANVTFGDESAVTVNFTLPFATAISGATIAPSVSGEVYSVSGMRLGKRDVKALKPGLYIVNGKKIVVK